MLSLGWLTDHGKAATVPSLTGKSLEEVKRVLDSTGFEWEVQDSVYVDSIPPLQIVKQFPDADEVVKAGRTIYLTINRMVPPQVEMPSLVGFSLKSAELYLQSLQLRSDRVAEINNKEGGTKILVKPEGTRANLLYATFKDLNGAYLIMNTDNLQSENQNDYAQVQFTYVPKDNIPYLDQKLFIIGAITNNVMDQNAEMEFDLKQGVYQKTLLLKQGYYSYNYILRDRNVPYDLDDFTETEGNHFETENSYTILVYYRAPGTLNDQLLGFTSINQNLPVLGHTLNSHIASPFHPRESNIFFVAASIPS